MAEPTYCITVYLLADSDSKENTNHYSFFNNPKQCENALRTMLESIDKGDKWLVFRKKNGEVLEYIRTSMIVKIKAEAIHGRPFEEQTDSNSVSIN